VPEVDDVPLVDELLPVEEFDDVVDPDVPEDDVPLDVLCDEPSVVGDDPGVPSKAAAWPRTESAFARPASGERNDA